MKRSALYTAIWTRSISRVARECGVSDTWLRAVCLRYNVPVPPRGHWQKVRAGHQVQQVPLPKGKDVEIGLKHRSNDDVDATDATDATDASAEGASREELPMKRGGSRSRSSAQAQSDLALEMVLLERDARQALRHRAKERLLADLTAALVMAPDLDAAAWGDWLCRVWAEVQRESPRSEIIEWAMKRFSHARQRAR